MQKITNFCISNRGWFHLSYLADWLIAGAMILVEVALTQYTVEPHDRYIPKDFQPLTYPTQQETVVWWLWGLMCFALPVLVFAVFQLGMRSPHDFHHAVLGLFEAVAISLVLTDTLRYFAGRNAPDWYARVRTGEPSIMRAGRLSFPSVHTSLAVASLSHLSMYMCGKFGVFKTDSGQFWKAVTSILPTCGAAMLSITRTIDYHNDFSDIAVGALIGIIVGPFCYYLNYPSLSSEACDLPKSRNFKKSRAVFNEEEDSDVPHTYKFSTTIDDS